MRRCNRGVIVKVPVDWFGEYGFWQGGSVRDRRIKSNDKSKIKKADGGV